MEWTAQSGFFWGLTWLLRLGIVAALWWGWTIYPVDGWLWTAAYLGLALLLFGLQRVTRRQALGWIVDDNGERQKVERWVRGHAIFNPTTRSQRIIEEAHLRDERRKYLIWHGLPGWGLAALAVYIWPHLFRSHITFYSFMLCVLLGGGALGSWFLNLGNEILYLSGWQDMKGAQVLDEPPMRPGFRDVLLQKTHGDARLATEQEVRDAAEGATSRSPVHDQEF